MDGDYCVGFGWYLQIFEMLGQHFIVNIFVHFSDK